MASPDKLHARLFHAGSSAEGLASQGTWGHDPTDEDEMLLFGQELCVHIPQGSQLSEKGLLVYHPKGCPPGYCKLEVNNAQALEQASVWGHQLGASCIRSSSNKHWLHTRNTLSRIQMAKRAITPDPVYGPTYLIGPSGQAASGLVEYVPTLVGNGPCPHMKEYRCRARGKWPPVQLVDEISRLPMLFVLVGYKCRSDSEPKSESDFDIQARQSWSHCEFKLISSLPKHIIQGYIAFKYTMKTFLSCGRSQLETIKSLWASSGGHIEIIKTLLASGRGEMEIEDGRSRIGSYHFKIVLLHHLEKQPQSLMKSSFDLILNLCYDLMHYIQNGNLPNYFLAKCNLLETVDPTDKRLAQTVVNIILSDPLHALLKSHAHPAHVYGNICPSELMAAFRQLSHNPTSSEYQRNLLAFLSPIDLRTKLHYVLQQVGDKNTPKTTMRPKPVGLVRSLEKIIDHRL